MTALSVLFLLAFTQAPAAPVPGMALAAIPAGITLALLSWTSPLSRAGAMRGFALLAAAAVLLAQQSAAGQVAGLETGSHDNQIPLVAKCAACAFAAAGLAVAARSPRSWH